MSSNMRNINIDNSDNGKGFMKYRKKRTFPRYLVPIVSIIIAIVITMRLSHQYINAVPSWIKQTVVSKISRLVSWTKIGVLACLVLMSRIAADKVFYSTTLVTSAEK